MKARTLRCGVGVFHPGPARIALITQCDCHITYHSTVPNRFLHQFDPVVQPIHTIHSDAHIRIAQRTEAARLATGLMAALLSSTNINEAPDAAMFPEATIARREQPPCVSA